MQPEVRGGVGAGAIHLEVGVETVFTLMKLNEITQEWVANRREPNTMQEAREMLRGKPRSTKRIEHSVK